MDTVTDRGIEPEALSRLHRKVVLTAGNNNLRLIVIPNARFVSTSIVIQFFIPRGDVGEILIFTSCSRTTRGQDVDVALEVAVLERGVLFPADDLEVRDVEGLLADADERGKARIAEIVSRGQKTDGAFDILIAEFLKHGENLPLYASYLARYGDERALPFLNAAAENEKISYADFEELRFAIEALGGECKVKRDFSADKTYKKIKGAKKTAKQL